MRECEIEFGARSTDPASAELYWRQITLVVSGFRFNVTIISGDTKNSDDWTEILSSTTGPREV